MTKCEICDREAVQAVHPCRFEAACSCWYGEPCHNVCPVDYKHSSLGALLNCPGCRAALDELDQMPERAV